MEENIFKDYHISGVVGSGFSSTVQTATYKPTGTPVAIKCIEKDKKCSKKDVEREISIMKKCNNPFIIQFYQKLETKSFIYIIEEFVHGGDDSLLVLLAFGLLFEIVIIDGCIFYRFDLSQILYHKIA